MEELKDLNQQFEDLHAKARELYRRGEYVAALEEWKIALTLCAGRPIQEQSVLSGIVEASVHLGEYEEAVRILSQIAKRKQDRGLNVPTAIAERIAYLQSLERASALRPPKAAKRTKH